MTHVSTDVRTAQRTPVWAPAVFLLGCAPVVADLLFGAIQLTTIVALVPALATYGCAALLIRGCARQRGAGWATVLIWGAAFAVIAECLIVQTSLAPLTGPHPDWGRAFGVNWTYLTWALGYESVWGIAVSIQLTDLVFPSRRDLPWPRRRSLLMLAVATVAAAGPTWFNWTHIVAPRLLHHPLYQPPPATLTAAAAAAAALIVTGGRLAPQRTQRTQRHTTRTDRARPPVVAALAAFTAAALWFALLLPLGSAITRVPPAVAIILAAAVALGTATLLRRWSRAPGWGDRHRLALISGALTASMAAGFLANHLAAIDLLGKAILNLAALTGLLLLHRRLRDRNNPRPPVPDCPP